MINLMTTTTFATGASNETLPGLLALVFAFAGVISILLYQLIKARIHSETEKLWREERKISKVDVAISLGYFHMRLYKTLKIMRN